jgi:hypothetical protein
MLCCECGERIVEKSKLADMCNLCYQVLDMDRFLEIEHNINGPFKCDRCRDWGKVLVRGKKNPAYMYVRVCPECAGGTK